MACLRVALLVTLITVSRGIESLYLSVSVRRSHFGESTTNVLSIPISHTRENLFPFGALCVGGCVGCWLDHWVSDILYRLDRVRQQRLSLHCGLPVHVVDYPRVWLVGEHGPESRALCKEVGSDRSHEPR